MDKSEQAFCVVCWEALEVKPGKGRIPMYCPSCRGKAYAGVKGQAQRSRMEENRKRLQAYKEEMGCMDCGGKFPYYVLDFDHLSDKAFKISGSYRVTKKRLEEEIAKCEVVCANCHRIRTHQRLH